jgi:hypothetical protein
MYDGDYVAMTIRANFIGVGPGPGADHVLNGALETRWTGSLEEVMEKR